MPLHLEEYYKNYIHHLQELMLQTDKEALEDAVELFLEARTNGRTIFFVGNGGSASTASHFAQDLANLGRKLKVKLFKSLSLTDNVSHITAAGNDYGYENVFTNQMEGLFQEGDVLVAISASGNSPNVLAAVRMARELGGKTIGIVGFDGGKLKTVSDYSIHIRSEHGEYGAVEDCHSILNHFMTTYIASVLKNEKAGLEMGQMLPKTETVTRQPGLV